MTYQDRWRDGKMTEVGERECCARYALIKAFCSNYKRPWTCLDIGAAQGYMGRRLIEDFPDCTVVSLEGDEVPENMPERMIWLHHKFTLDDLREIASCEHFDVVLGMSVIHHFEGTFAERLEVFRSLGDNLILELAWEPNACGGEQKEYEIPLDAFIIGEGKSHLVEGGVRKILLLNRMKPSIKKAYIGGGREDLSLTIYSDFLLKTVKFNNKKESRNWHPGINLRTALSYNVVWPTRAQIIEQVEAQRDAVIASNHNDCVAHNVILQGPNAVFIDGAGPMDETYPVVEFFDKLIAELRA